MPRELDTYWPELAKLLRKAETEVRSIGQKVRHDVILKAHVAGAADELSWAARRADVLAGRPADA